MKIINNITITNILSGCLILGSCTMTNQYAGPHTLGNTYVSQTNTKKQNDSYKYLTLIGSIHEIKEDKIILAGENILQTVNSGDQLIVDTGKKNEVLLQADFPSMGLMWCTIISGTLENISIGMPVYKKPE
jgi:hypothetical protein